MKIRSKISYVVAGFVGGVAFLISCGGGSGGSLVSDVEAAVPAEQMLCKLTDPGTAQGNYMIYEGTSAFPNGTPVPNSLACYDTSGVNQTTSIDIVYSQGWRIQGFLIGSSLLFVR